MNQTASKESALRTWVCIFLLCIVILFQGSLSFVVVGDLGQPDWDFGAIRDLPGESPYAVYPLNNPQHVRGSEEEIRVPGGVDRK
jgi:hypothetical protein